MEAEKAIFDKYPSQICVLFSQVSFQRWRKEKVPMQFCGKLMVNRHLVYIHFFLGGGDELRMEFLF